MKEWDVMEVLKAPLKKYNQKKKEKKSKNKN